MGDFFNKKGKVCHTLQARTQKYINRQETILAKKEKEKNIELLRFEKKKKTG